MDLVVGRVVKAHGVTGEIVVDVRTDDPQNRFAPGITLRGRRRRSGTEDDFRIESVRTHGDRLLVRLVGIGDRDAADELRGTLFLVDTAELPAIDDPDEFYDHELEGLTVSTVDGAEVGTVGEVLHTAAGELLAVKRADGTEVLIPFVSAIVVSVSRVEGTAVIDPPDGLLDLDG